MFNINNSGQVGQQNIGQSGGEAKADVTFNIGGGSSDPVEVTLAEIVKADESLKDEAETIQAEMKAVESKPEAEQQGCLSRFRAFLAAHASKIGATAKASIKAAIDGAKTGGATGAFVGAAVAAVEELLK